jgi:hypothetical protein
MKAYQIRFTCNVKDPFSGVEFLNESSGIASEEKDEIKKIYQVEENASGWLNFYTEQAETVTEEELSQYISMKLIQRLDSIDEKVNTMKNIMIFWVVLSIIGSIIGVFLIAGS